MKARSVIIVVSVMVLTSDCLELAESRLPGAASAASGGGLMPPGELCADPPATPIQTGMNLRPGA